MFSHSGKCRWILSFYTHAYRFDELEVNDIIPCDCIAWWLLVLHSHGLAHIRNVPQTIVMNFNSIENVDVFGTFLHMPNDFVADLWSTWNSWSKLASKLWFLFIWLNRSNNSLRCRMMNYSMLLYEDDCIHSDAKWQRNNATLPKQLAILDVLHLGCVFFYWNLTKYINKKSFPIEKSP